MKRNSFSFTLALLAALILSSCSTQSIVLKKGFNFGQIKRVAVLQFKDPSSASTGFMIASASSAQSTGAMVAQLFVKYLLRAGYNLVERDELDAILREKELSESNLMNPETVRKLKLSGIDAIVTGTVTRYAPEQNFFQNGYEQFTPAQVGITCRMIDAGTGEILWAGADTYDAVNTQTAFDYLTSSLVMDLTTELLKTKNN